MKPYTRQASVIWRGRGRRGQGVIATPRSVVQRATPTCGRDFGRSGANPPELIAAAHAGSFSMTLAHELNEAGYRPTQVETTASITMEKLAARWTMTQIQLDVIATVMEVSQCEFVDAALRAKANCPISRSLNVNISMCAKLMPQGEAAHPSSHRP